MTKRNNKKLIWGVWFTLLLAAIIPLAVSINQRQELRSLAASKFVQSDVAKGGGLTAMEFAPDGRLFFLEKAGTVKIVKNNQVLATPFLKLTGVNSEGERGLLGIAFDPNFATNKYVYFYYTVANPLHNRIIRVAANGDVAGSPQTIFDLPGLGATNHNGGAIHFGPDGKLYVGVGENANGQNASSMNTILGKMLRINPDGTIPADNPFYGSTTGNNRAIWATGMRNPFTFAVQPGTGRIFANDVGDNGDKRFEEIDDIQKGKSYGWPTAWGNGGSGGDRPVYNYQGGGCAITGGTFYNPTTVSFPTTYVGKYFFGDYCGNWVKYIDPSTKQVSTFDPAKVSAPVDLKVGPEGALYVLSANGSIVKIAYVDENGNPLPTVSQAPGGGTAGAPKGTITSPKAETKYNAGQTISYSGTGTDPQDGTLADKAFSWTIVFHHATHTHPFLGPITGKKAGTFTIPAQGEWASNVWYRINLTVTDSAGQTQTSYVDVKPNVVTLTFNTVPSGLQTAIDGVPNASPYTQSTVVGLKRTISTTEGQTLNGKSYAFASWSDKGTTSHEITIPAKDTTYTATFQEGAPSGTIVQPTVYCLGSCPTPGGSGGGETPTVSPAPTGTQSTPDANTRRGLFLSLLDLIIEFLNLLGRLLGGK